MAKLHYRSYNPNQIILFPQRIDEDIAGNDPVRIISAIIDQLDLSKFHKLYHGIGRCAYHPRMMLKVIVYAYMNNIYSCRKIEKRKNRKRIHLGKASLSSPKLQWLPTAFTLL